MVEAPSQESDLLPTRGAVSWTEKLGFPRIDRPGAGTMFLSAGIDALGTGLFLSFYLLYLTRVAGFSLGAAGLALTVASGAALAATPIAGGLVDRVGARTLVIAAQALGAVGFLALFVVGSLPALLIAAFCISLAERVFWVGFPTLVASMAVPTERDRWFALAGMLREAGIGAGALLAGGIVWLLGRDGYTVLLAGNAISFAVTAVLIAIRVPPAPRAAVAKGRSGGYRALLRNRAVVMLAGANTAVIFALMLTVLTLPIYAVERLDQAEWLPGVLLGINTLVLAVGQTVTLRIVAGWRRTRVLAMAGGLWAVTAIAFAFALALPAGMVALYLVACAVLAAVGDALHGQMTMGLPTALTAEVQHGRAIALFGFSWGVARTAAPTMVAGLLAIGSVMPWIAVVICAAIASVIAIAAEPHVPAASLRFPPREVTT